MQNLATITEGVSFPRMCEIAHQKRLLGFLRGFFQRPTPEASEPIFTRNTSNDAVPRKDVPFRGQRTKNLIFKPLFPKNRHFGPGFDGT